MMACRIKGDLKVGCGGIGAAALCLALLLLILILVANNTSAISLWDTKYKNLFFNLTQARAAPIIMPEYLKDDQRRIQTANLTEHRDALWGEIKALRDEREALRAERENLRNERNNLKIQSNNMTKDRDGLRDERDGLKNERVALKDERAQLSVYFSNLTSYRGALREEQEALRNERGALKNDREQLRMQHNLSDYTDVLNYERQALREERVALTDERRVLKEEREVLKNHSLVLSKDIDILREKLDAMTEERDSLERQISNLTEEVGAVLNQFTALAESRDKLQEELDALKYNQQNKTCLPGWVAYQNKCYFHSSQGLSETWSKSRQDCQARGGDLAMPKTQQELVHVGGGNGITWIGLSDKLKEGKWQWVDGTDLKGDGFWKEGEPNNSDSNEDCVELARDQLKWNDAPCSRKFPWTCEGQPGLIVNV